MAGGSVIPLTPTLSPCGGEGASATERRRGTPARVVPPPVTPSPSGRGLGRGPRSDRRETWVSSRGRVL